jgi:hypothetical protein
MSKDITNEAAELEQYNLNDFHINVVWDSVDCLQMRSLFGIGCVASFFVWDMVFDEGLYTKLIAAVGHYWLAMFWHLVT